MDKLQQHEMLERLLSTWRDRPERPASREPEVVPSHDHWARVVLLERAACLRKMARFSEGSASETVKEYPAHSAELAVRLRSGEPELDEDSARLMLVLDGQATLLTGGVIEGSRIEGGANQELRPGDLVHLAPGTLHQMLLAGEKTISCLVVRIMETAEN